MKVLATESPKTATVKVTGRSARKHYGLQCDTDFIRRRHDVTRRSVALSQQSGFQPGRHG